MMTLSEPPSVLSSPQRRCQVLLMLFLPGQIATSERISLINQVDETITREDVEETHHEIQRYHRLTIVTHADGSYRIEGTALDQRLCLLHWLRRSLRLCPDFIARQFTPALKTELRRCGISRILYDDINLQAMINRCARSLNRQFDGRDSRFLCLFLQYCLLQQQPALTPQFSESQRQWARACPEYQVTADIARHWQRRTLQQPHPDEHLFLALLFMLLKVPDPRRDHNTQDIRLYRAVNRLIDRFQRLAGRPFADREGLRDQLYIHLSQAANRCLYDIGIDSSLPEEIHRLYPRLMRTTREAMSEFEASWQMKFNEEELGLIGVIFGAWLMQESDRHEKQVLLLTGNDGRLEQAIEQQLRELTLLPLNIKYLPLDDFHRHGIPKEVALVITPYAIPLPLFSPPIVHVGEVLSDNQCRHLRQMLEGAA